MRVSDIDDARNQSCQERSARFSEGTGRQPRRAATAVLFGSPMLIVGDDLFVGNDRLDFLEARAPVAESRTTLVDVIRRY